MSQKKPSAMTVQNTGNGGQDFEPDPLLDPKGDYEARIIGYAYIGKQEKDEFNSKGQKTGETKVEPQAIIGFELTEPETYVERGTEEEPKQVRRIMYKFIKDSSHEKSNLFKIASNANPEAAWIEKDDKGKDVGRVDPVEIMGCPISLKLKVKTDESGMNISDTNPIPTKYRDGVPELEAKPFMFHVDHGCFNGTTIEDVPPWILRMALDKAVDVETFGMLEEMEAQREKNDEEAEAKKEGKLPGDDKPANKSSEDKREDKSPKKEEAEKKPSRRSRRGSKKTDKPDYSGMSLEELEDLLIEKAVLTEDELDDIGAENEDDNEYKAALVAKAEESL